MVQCITTIIIDHTFPLPLLLWSLLLCLPLGTYLCLVHWQKWQNFEVDELRAEAYQTSKIDNSGVICDEDLLLKDGVT